MTPDFATADPGLADAAEFPGPEMIITCATAYPRRIEFAAFVTNVRTRKVLRGPRGGMIPNSREHAEAIHGAVFPAIQGGPLMHVVAAKTVAFEKCRAFAAKKCPVAEGGQSIATGVERDGADGPTIGFLTGVPLRPTARRS
ncbi:hypothetical protein [Kibdelosporangium philippinense]|uniref:hypothetical protein n=1 Tax=Kibdelosporangium philippinense TaxID=211113 RepID=UPI0027E024C3|nr:hypothetical protein [Kibdelosporangium philippinense]